MIPLRLMFKGEQIQESPLLDETSRVCMKVNGFTGDRGQVLRVPDDRGGIATVIAGLGTAERFDPLDIAQLSATLPSGTYLLDALPGGADERLIRFAWALGTYRFDRYRSSTAARPAPQLRIESSDARQAQLAAVTYSGCQLAQDLINTPAADCGPAEFEVAAREVAAAHSATIRVVSDPQELRAGFPLVHAVGRASERAPRVIDMSWGNETDPLVTLVGKGVCFDTGGLALKPLDRMRHMKKDMGGAAHVLALAHMVMSLRLRLRLRVLLPMVDNSIGERAIHVGDVIRARNGTTVEIAHPDAEGRLVLADALAAAAEEQPDLLVDFATLTSVMRSVIGPDIAPFFSSDDELAGQIEAAAALTADPVWRVPLHPGYRRWLVPGIADLANHRADLAGGEPIFAALFLERFIGQVARWIHFDIFAWSGEHKPGRAPGAVAQGLRAMLEVLRLRYPATPPS
jgi:leucyl aminopeptidase